MCTSKLRRFDVIAISLLRHVFRGISLMISNTSVYSGMTPGAPFPNVNQLPAWMSNYINYKVWDEIAYISKHRRLHRLILGMDK